MALKLDMIGITVADMSKALRFYRLLDIDIPESEPGEDHVEAILPNGLRIAWDALSMVKEIDPHWVVPQGHRQGLAFLCDSPAGVDAAYETILSAGFAGKSAPWDAFWGRRYAQVYDPDGNAIDLFASLTAG